MQKTGVLFTMNLLDKVYSLLRASAGQQKGRGKGKISRNAPLTPVVLVVGRKIRMLLSS